MSDNSDNTKKGKKRRGTLLNYILGGLFLKSDIIRENSLLLGLIVLYAFIYVSTSYEHRNEIMKINQLTKIRNDRSNELVIVKSEFAEKNKRSRIEELIDTLDIGVKTSHQAPYKISR